MDKHNPDFSDTTNIQAQNATAESADEKSTRELILDAAFSFYKEPRYTDFSLSEVAAKVGISKTAIFRHVANKEKLLDAMRERLIDMIYAQVCVVSKEFKKNNECENSEQPFAKAGAEPGKNSAHGTLYPVARALEYFADRPEYSFYLVNQFLVSPDFEAVIVHGCEERGFHKTAKTYTTTADGKKITVGDCNKYTASIYVAVSLFFFLQVRFKKVAEGTPVSDAKTFSEKAVAFVENGLAGSISKTNPHYPQQIADERFAELDALCKIDESQMPEENRIFTALASVINKNKFPGVTVQKIADELPMAKSSLYSYFNNKNELIRSLIEKEIYAMKRLIQQNGRNGANISERIYMTLRTELAYFMKRPSLISVCGWLRMSGSYYEEAKNKFPDFEKTPDEDCCASGETMNLWMEEMHAQITEPDVGVPVTIGVLAGWVSALPVTLLLQGRNHGMSDNDLFVALRKIFMFIEYGINTSDL